MVDIRQVSKDALTENDGSSYDLIRIGGAFLIAVSVPTFAWATVYATLSSGHFDYMGFAAGVTSIGSVILMLAGGVSIKARTDQIGNPTSPSPPTGTP